MNDQYTISNAHALKGQYNLAQGFGVSAQSNGKRRSIDWVLRFVTAFYNQRLKIAAPATNALIGKINKKNNQ